MVLPRFSFGADLGYALSLWSTLRPGGRTTMAVSFKGAHFPGELQPRGVVYRIWVADSRIVAYGTCAIFAPIHRESLKDAVAQHVSRMHPSADRTPVRALRTFHLTKEAFQRGICPMRDGIWLLRSSQRCPKTFDESLGHLCMPPLDSVTLSARPPGHPRL